VKSLKLTPDGLKIADKKPTKMEIANNAGAKIFTMLYVQNSYRDYIIYSTQGVTNGVKVAESHLGILGPYTANDDFLLDGLYSDPSVVRDVDNVKDVLFFSNAPTFPYGIFAADLKWDMWPIVIGSRT